MKVKSCAKKIMSFVLSKDYKNFLKEKKAEDLNQGVWTHIA